MSAAHALLDELQAAGVDVTLSASGGIRLSGQRPAPALLEAANAQRDALVSAVRYRADPPPGSDLITRPGRDDARYAGVDLAARAHDRDALALGLRRVTPYLELSPATRERVDAIAAELREAGPDEIGRWACDVMMMYFTPNLPKPTEAAMYYVWALSLEPVDLEDLRS